MVVLRTVCRPLQFERSRELPGQLRWQYGDTTEDYTRRNASRWNSDWGSAAGRLAST